MNILTDKEDRLLSTKDAANATGFHQNYFNTLLVKGTIKGEKNEKGRWQFKQSELDKYLASNAVKPRRAKKFMDKDTDNKPAKSLFTQLDEKEKIISEKDARIAELNQQLTAAKSRYSDLENQTADEINDLQSQLDDKDVEIEKLNENIGNLQSRNIDLTGQIFEHNEFLRTTLSQVILGVLGTDAGK